MNINNVLASGLSSNGCIGDMNEFIVFEKDGVYFIIAVITKYLVHWLQETEIVVVYSGNDLNTATDLMNIFKSTCISEYSQDNVNSLINKIKASLNKCLGDKPNPLIKYSVVGLNRMNPKHMSIILDP